MLQFSEWGKNFRTNNMSKICQLLMIFVLASPAISAEDSPLKGTAFLGEEGCPGGIKSEDCVLSFQLSGKAAKMLYDGMRVKAVKEECTGGMEKSDGKGLNCIKSADGEYNCDFGYSFSKKAFTGGFVDC
jgi:hypothetical protein